MQQVRREEAVLEQVQEPLGVRQLWPRDDIDVWDGDARQQPAAAVLVHGDTPAHVDQEDVLGQGDAAPTRAQALPAHMGDDAQAAQRDGRAGLEV